MASSDGLDEDCVLQRGRSQSDPSSITEVRLGEAHRAGKEEKVGVRMAGWGLGGAGSMLDACHLISGLCCKEIIIFFKKKRWMWKTFVFRGRRRSR